MSKFTVPRSLKRVVAGALGAVALMAGINFTPVTQANASPRCESNQLSIRTADFSLDLRNGCWGRPHENRGARFDHVDRRNHDRGRWPGDWGANEVREWRWAKDGALSEWTWRCPAGFVWTDRRFAPDNIVFNDVTCGRGSAFAAYRIGPNGQEQTGVFWR